MPRRKDDPTLGRYVISPTTYKAIKRDLRRLYKASQSALEAPETADMDTLLKEVRRVSLTTKGREFVNALRLIAGEV